MKSKMQQQIQDRIAAIVRDDGWKLVEDSNGYRLMTLPNHISGPKVMYESKTLVGLVDQIRHMFPDNAYMQSVYI